MCVCVSVFMFNVLLSLFIIACVLFFFLTHLSCYFFLCVCVWCLFYVPLSSFSLYSSFPVLILRCCFLMSLCCVSSLRPRPLSYCITVTESDPLLGMLRAFLCSRFIILSLIFIALDPLLKSFFRRLFAAFLFHCIALDSLLYMLVRKSVSDTHASVFCLLGWLMWLSHYSLTLLDPPTVISSFRPAVHS